MKTQTFGLYNISLSDDFLVVYPHNLHLYCRDYRDKRENGNEKDDPVRYVRVDFPMDGKITWPKGRVKGNFVYGVKESDGKYYYTARYDEGVRDKAWMAEKDRNYIARLKRMHEKGEQMDAVEQKDFEEVR